jgi:ribonuclease HI
MNTMQSDVLYVTDPEPDVTIYCDGLCEPNPRGLACWGWYALDCDGQPIGQQYGVTGQGEGMTNNTAEYAAVLQALAWAYKAGYRKPLIKSDSQLLVNQVIGAWGCGDNLAPFLTRVRGAQRVMAIRVEWVKREQNALADALSRRAYFERTGKQPPNRPPKRRS